MSQKTVDTWTAEDVHWWLMTEVKVHQSCADRFTEEEVLGDCLVSFTKTDILDLGIKHGPAVKITSYLESLKHGSKHHSDFPAYVDKWTKEQVSEWLLQHVKVYSKYAERLQEEGVSGDCLVCFRKQDFLDIGVKSGPAVKILTELHQLNQRPEPILQPVLQTGSDQRQVEHPLSRSFAVNEPASLNKAESNQSNKEAPSQTKPPEEDQRREPWASGATPKEAAAVNFQSYFYH